MKSRISLLLLVALTAAAVVLAPAEAKDRKAKDWEVKGQLTGKVGKKSGKLKASEDMSGIACATAKGFPRTCLVIDDDLQAAQVVTLTDGKIEPGGMIPLIDDKYANGEPVSLDGEGIAFADNYFYVLGSHGMSRGKNKDKEDAATVKARMAAELKASSKLIRLAYNPANGTIAADPATPPSPALGKLIQADPVLMAFKDTVLEDGGITLEGIAVAGGRLYAGLRGPVIQRDDKDHAVILSVALGHFFGGEAADVHRHELELGKERGVRDLAAFDNGILILAGPVKSVGGVYSVFWWDGKSKRAKRLDDLPKFPTDDEAKKPDEKQWKPEALLPLDRDKNGVRVLLLLDGVDNGAPREFGVAYP